MSAPGDDVRQQVLFCWLAHSGLDASVVGWAFHDGSGRDSELPVPHTGAPPYATGMDALRDGWRLIQVSALPTAAPGDEHRIGHLKHEFVFERFVPLSPDDPG